MNSAVTNFTRFPTRRGTVWLILDDSEKPVRADDVREALGKIEGLSADPKPAVELRSVEGGRAHYLVSFWASDRDAATSAALTALRARFPQGEVHGG
jgi:hypothetical protein